jgi:hypothetical protein
MKEVFRVIYQITDNGINHPQKEEEVIVPKNTNVYDCLLKLLKKYRHSMCLSTKFTVKVISATHDGWCK